MSAIQLLESIATNPSLKSQVLSDALDKSLQSDLNNFITENENNKLPMYCVFFPAKDKKPSDKDDKEGEEKKEENINQIH